MPGAMLTAWAAWAEWKAWICNSLRGLALPQQEVLPNPVIPGPQAPLRRGFLFPDSRGLLFAVLELFGARGWTASRIAC
jgi:hypothetical protein